MLTYPSYVYFIYLGEDRNQSSALMKYYQALVILCTCWGSFQINLPVAVYRFAHINRDIFLGFVLGNLLGLFSRICSQYLLCFQLLDYHNIFLSGSDVSLIFLPTIHVVMWINTFAKYETKIVEFSSQNFCVFWKLLASSQSKCFS